MALWSVIESEAQDLLDDAVFESNGSQYARLMAWGNRVIYDIARRLSIPDFLTSADLLLTTADYRVSLPANFMKVSRRLTKVYVGDDEIPQRGIDEIIKQDANHNYSTSSTMPSLVCLSQPYLYAYPSVNCTATISLYYRTPTSITATSDSPDLPDANVINELLVNGVVKHGFRFLNEMELMGHAESEFEKYLALYEKELHIDQFNRKSVPA